MQCEHVFVLQEQERFERIRRGYDSQEPLDSIAAELGLSRSRVCTLAKHFGLRQPRRRPDDETIEHWCRRYSEGSSITELAREGGWHRDTIRRTLCGSDVPMRGHQQGRKWHVDHDAFSEPLSAEAWYWIGMLAADGCVLGPTIELTQTDKALLQRFLVFLKVPDAPIRSHIVHQNVRSVRVRSARLAGELAKHGIVERKSLSLRVSEEAAREPAFWLGELDGDGCAEVAVAGGAPRISFLGSRALMDQCAEFIAREVVLRRPRAERRRWKRPRVRRHAPHSDRLWQVTVNGHTARELALVLLRSHHSSLARKRARLEAIARYESPRTLSQRDSRPRRCAYCRAWVDRYPSQMRTPRVFCSRSHAARWRAEQQLLNRAAATL